MHRQLSFGDSTNAFGANGKVWRNLDGLRIGNVFDDVLGWSGREKQCSQSQRTYLTA